MQSVQADLLIFPHTCTCKVSYCTRFTHKSWCKNEVHIDFGRIILNASFAFPTFSDNLTNKEMMFMALLCKACVSHFSATAPQTLHLL